MKESAGTSARPAREMCSRRSPTRQRLRILRLLMAGDVCVCDIHDALKIPQAKASRHLAYLRRAGAGHHAREGLWVHYSLAKSADPIVAAIEDATTHVLGHVESLKKDAARLEKRTGCCSARPPGRPTSPAARPLQGIAPMTPRRYRPCGDGRLSTSSRRCSTQNGCRLPDSVITSIRCSSRVTAPASSAARRSSVSEDGALLRIGGGRCSAPRHRTWKRADARGASACRGAWASARSTC